MRVNACQRALDDVAVRVPEHDATGEVQQVFVGVAGKFFPEGERSFEEGHICGIFEVRLANDA